MDKTTTAGYINHNGFRFAQAIRNISEDYQVARFRARQRIVNMGHITAKGANNFDPDTKGQRFHEIERRMNAMP